MTTPGDWEELLLDIKLCQDCGPGPRAVYRGNPSAKILIVGQAPGREEAKQGKPFVGPAGKVLDQALVSAGLTEEDVLITNPVFFWPRDPDDRRPRAEEVAHGREHLNWILEHVKPKLIIPLGDLATKLFINSPWGMTKLSGQMQEGNIYPIIHPAAILHNPALRPKWEEAWRNLKPTVTRIAEREEPEQPAETPWGPEQPFVHLHNHSEYSKLDGHQTLKEMLEEARRRGFRTIALTDHGTLAGWANFYRKAQAVGIKPILGVEAYLADTRITKEYMHLVLLAETLEGYHNLIRVTSAASAEGTGRTILVWEDLPRLQGCVALTACAGGVVGKPVGKGDFVQAKRNVERLVAALGPNGVFLEVQAHADWKPQADVNKAAIQIARHLELPIMATNDCHYAHTNGWEIQDVMLAVRDNVALDYPDRMRYDVHDLWIKDAAEVRRDLLASGVSAADVAEAMANSVRLAERCKVEVPRGRNILPKPPIPEGEDPNAFFLKLAWEGLARRLPDKADLPEYRARMERELGLHIAQGFADYMLIVWELISWAKKNDITVGPGRGSVSSSLVAFCLGITDVDPVQHDIILERFVSEVRTDMPDIDVDVQDNRREDLVQHLRDLYGPDNVAHLGTEVRWHGRLALRDVCRVLGYPKEDVDPVSNAIVYRSGGDTRANYTIEDSFAQFEVCKKFDRRYPKVRPYAVQLEGRIRNYGRHACGLLLTPTPVTEWVPLEKRAGDTSSAWTLEDCEWLGLLKLDVLGITGLSMVHKCLELVQVKTGEAPDLGSISLADPVVLNNFERRETAGVFQFGSLGLRRLCERLRKAKGAPLTFNDLVVMNTLHRPAMLNIGLHQEYLYRVSGQRAATYLHPVQEKHLKGTLGIAMFQEQIMMICRELGGLTWEHVAGIRKIISKRQGAEMFRKAQDVFVEGAVHNGCNAEIAKRIFMEMSYAGFYAFNKAHAVAYTLLAYRQMWLKTHFPTEYHAALLICETWPGAKPAYILSARRADITVLPPDVNRSDAGYSTDGEAIRAGLADIDGVGISAAREIVSKQPYANLTDLHTRVDRRLVHSRVVERLITAGAFKSLHANTKALLASWKPIAEEMLKDGDSRGRQRTLGGDFAFVPQAREKLAMLAFEDEYAPEEEAALMRSVLRWPSEVHPITAYAEQLALIHPSAGLRLIKDVEMDQGSDHLLVAGIVTVHNWKIEGLEGQAIFDETAHPEGYESKYVHLNIEDGTDFILAHFEPRIYNKHKEQLEQPDGWPIVLEGNLRAGMGKVYVSNFTTLTEWAERARKGEAMTPFERRLLRHPMLDYAGWKGDGVVRMADLPNLWPLGMRVRVLALAAYVRERDRVWHVCLQDVGTDGRPISRIVLCWPDAAAEFGDKLHSGAPVTVDLVPMQETNLWAISGRANCKVEYAAT